MDDARVSDGLRALRCLELLNGEFSLFTLALPDGRKQVCVQDANCERRFEVTGVDLLDAFSQAATVIALDQAADNAERLRLLDDTESLKSAARDAREPDDGGKDAA